MNASWSWAAWVSRLLVFAVGWAAAAAARALYRVVRRNAILRRQFRGPPTSSFLLGTLADNSWAEQRHLHVLRETEQYGPNYHIRLAWVDVVVLTEPSLVAEVLHSRELDKVPEVYRSVSKMMSATGHPDLVSGLTDANWRLFRKGLAPAFSPANIRAGFKYTAAAVNELTAILKAAGSGKAVDMDQACLCETMDVISRFAFGYEFGAVKLFGQGGVAELMDTMKKAESEIERRLADPTREFVWWLTKDGRAAGKYFRHFQDIMRRLLADVKGRLEDSPPDSDQSLAAHLLRLRDPGSGKPLPDEKLLPHIGMFFFAGHDTTGHTMAWTLYLISQHPEVEAKIVAELDAAGLLATPQNPEPRPLTHDDLASLTFLGAAIKESMRMYAVVGTATIRVAQTDILLGGKYRIPEGTGMWTPIYAIHNSSANWEQPDKYLPERWLQPGAEYVQSDGTSEGSAYSGQIVADKSNTKARSYELNVSRGSMSGAAAKRFIPFSDGRRDCIGQPLAKMNYTAAIAMLLSHFTFRLSEEMGGVEGVRRCEHMAMTLQPGKGLLMHAIARASAS